MKNKKKLISIIIRTKDEEAWIESCLNSILSQSIKNVEIIIVDNYSQDNSLKIFKKFGLKKIYKIKNYKPGKALNLGISKSTGDYIVCLSPHCIPKGQNWLKNLIKSLNRNDIGAVYGRQLPMSYSSALDKRDLLTVFGLDKKIQIKDFFFHNANSAFRKSIWRKYHFDNEVSNVEDRLWAKNLIQKKFKIIYEPKAAVYHWHGINQYGDTQRAENIVRILEEDKGFFEFTNSIKITNPKILSIIPIKGYTLKYKDISLLEKTVKSLTTKKYDNEIIVSSDNQNTIKFAKTLNIKTVGRPEYLSEKYIDILEVANFTIKKTLKSFGDRNIVVIAQETYPLRDKNLINQLTKKLVDENLDAVVTTSFESRSLLHTENLEIFDFKQFFIPRELNSKRKSLIFLPGLMFITKVERLINKSWQINKIKFHQIKDSLNTVEFRNVSSIKKLYNFLK